MAAVAADVAAALTALGGPVPVVGVSTGGSIAQQLAVDHPGAVDRLVLVSTAYHLGPLAREAQARALRLAEQGRDRLAWLALASAVVRPGAARRLLGTASWLTAGEVPDSVRCLLAAEDAFDLRHEAHRISAPTLVVAGDRDRCYPLELVRDTADAVPGARLVVLEGRGHLGVWVDRRLPQLVLDFLDEHRRDLPPDPAGSQKGGGSFASSSGVAGRPQMRSRVVSRPRPGSSSGSAPRTGGGSSVPKAGG
jgi:pimeloyl-ACP methyl ester carboxylesterase